MIGVSVSLSAYAVMVNKQTNKKSFLFLIIALLIVHLCNSYEYYQFNCLSSYSSTCLCIIPSHCHPVTSYWNVGQIIDMFGLFINVFYEFRNVPWYVDDEWNYVKGQLSTVDRHYGHVHSIIHSIGTHQIHHLFPKIPHYHLGVYIHTLWIPFLCFFILIICRGSYRSFSQIISESCSC